MTPFLTIAANMRCRLFCFCPSAFCRCSSRAFLSPTETGYRAFGDPGQRCCLMFFWTITLLRSAIWVAAGAAVATGIGYFIAAVFGLYFARTPQEAPLHFVKKPRASMQTLMRAMTNGSSEMVSNLSTSVTTFLFNIIMMRLIGPDGVAAISIAFISRFCADRH